MNTLKSSEFTWLAHYGRAFLFEIERNNKDFNLDEALKQGFYIESGRTKQKVLFVFIKFENEVAKFHSKINQKTGKFVIDLLC